MHRRNFLKGLGATFALSSLPGTASFAFNPRVAAPNNQEILVFIFLKGGCDALNLLAPVADPSYLSARPKGLRVSQEPDFLLKNGLGGLQFGLHEKAKALKELYVSKDLAFVHAMGSPHNTRSHFEAQSYMEMGLAGNNGSISSGWMTRYFQSIRPEGLLPVVNVGAQGLSNLLLGHPTAYSVHTLEEIKLKGGKHAADMLAAFYEGDTPLAKMGQHTLQTTQQLAEQAKQAPHPHTDYPSAWYIQRFSQDLQELAKLIKLDTGVQMAVVELDGWDHHDNQLYHFPQLIEGFSKALSAFYNDLNRYHNRLTIVTMSEFGRRLKSNRNMGTDHGHAGLSMILGGRVKGGRLYGQWPGLSNEQLNRRVDLEVTTDYRTILHAILKERFQAKELATIFPGFDSTKVQPLNFL
jgi:uncharacterized protein (DUF1501 family)